MYININLDATAVNNQVKMNFKNDPTFDGNTLLTPVGRLEVLAKPAHHNLRPSLGGMQQSMGAFMYHPESGIGQYMLENGSFTFNGLHEDIMEGTVEHLIDTLSNVLKVTETTVVNVIPFGNQSSVGNDIHVRFVVPSVKAIQFEKFPSGWRVWNVTTRTWEQFMVVFALDGVFTLAEPPAFVTLHLGRGDVTIYLDKDGLVTHIDTPDDVAKFSIDANNEIFQYLKAVK